LEISTMLDTICCNQDLLKIEYNMKNIDELVVARDDHILKYCYICDMLIGNSRCL